MYVVCQVYKESAMTFFSVHVLQTYVLSMMTDGVLGLMLSGQNVYASAWHECVFKPLITGKCHFGNVPPPQRMGCDVNEWEEMRSTLSRERIVKLTQYI
jgi:hypothetical protein